MNIILTLKSGINVALGKFDKKNKRSPLKCDKDKWQKKKTHGSDMVVYRSGHELNLYIVYKGAEPWLFSTVMLFLKDH